MDYILNSDKSREESEETKKTLVNEYLEVVN